MMMPRRSAIAALGAVFGSVLTSQATKAQFTEQEIRNNAQVVSTGDVRLNQNAEGAQNVEVLIDGVWQSQDGIYRTQTGQVVINDGQVVSTGNVELNQSARGSQNVRAVYSGGYYDGMPADVCEPGKVIADPGSGQLFYQANDCCFYQACAVNCQKTCRGDRC
jgi:hypothetical protein